MRGVRSHCRADRWYGPCVLSRTRGVGPRAPRARAWTQHHTTTVALSNLDPTPLFRFRTFRAGAVGNERSSSRWEKILMHINSLGTLFVEELRDAYSAETQ